MQSGFDEPASLPVNPETCHMVGKQCRDCVADNAAAIALLCPSLDAAGAQHVFFQMYRHHGCGAMLRSFVREYLGAVEPEFIEIPQVTPLYQIAACA